MVHTKQSLKETSAHTAQVFAQRRCLTRFYPVSWEIFPLLYLHSNVSNALDVKTAHKYWGKVLICHLINYFEQILPFFCHAPTPPKNSWRNKLWYVSRSYTGELSTGAGASFLPFLVFLFFLPLVWVGWTLVGFLLGVNKRLREECWRPAWGWL